MTHIASKIIALSAGIALAISIGFGVLIIRATDQSDSSGLQILESTMREDYDNTIRAQVVHAISTLQSLYDMSQKGDLSEAQARQIGAQLLRTAQYGKDSYFWADTYEGLNIVYLGRTDSEGHNRFDSVDKKGNHYIRDIIAHGQEAGGGFTDYWFPKKDGPDAFPKRSYSLEFKPFGWVIGTGNYIDDIGSAIETKRSELELQAAHLKVIFGLFILALFLISGGLSFIFGKRLAEPIQRLADALHEIAQGEGDLDQTLIIRTRDETGVISREFNLFTEKLNAIIVSIRSSTGLLSEIGHDLSSNAVETASAVYQITSNIESMNQLIQNQSASVLETSATMTQISGNIANLTELIERQSASLSHSSAAIEEMVSNIASVASNIDLVSERFDRLLSAADNGKIKLNDVNLRIAEIETMSQTLRGANAMIASIAAQTNLLAMNAAIEAAHAGDAGRGFSVVADEIRKLAENASGQSRSVAGNVKNILASIEKAVAASHEAELAFDQTRTMIKEVDELESTVKLSMVEQNEGSQQILQTLMEINAITGKVRDGSAEMNSGSQQVAQEMNRLAAQTQEIRSGMTEIAAGTNEINQALNSISDLGLRNKEQVESVQRETERFKIRSK